MNLNVIYELRNRLEMAAIAGVNLISEDFRLKRAVEQVAPLAGVSPVFKKIYALSVNLISSDCQDPSGVLLDTLALVDAVCVTQGSLMTEGEVHPAKETTEGWNSVGKNYPYSVMAPVTEAFRGTGSGRYAVIKEAYETTPELFEDFRIQRLMVQALGDSYAELADMVERWLTKKGIRIIPLLKQDFKPDGKRDMARRLHVIEEVAGREENDFYRSLLMNSEAEEALSKEVKEAAIFALRHDNMNDDLLLDLLKAEKGKMKEQVQAALAYLDSPKVQEYWTQAMKKKPAQTANYLTNSRTDWASDLIAHGVGAWVEEYTKEENKKAQSKLSRQERQEEQKKQLNNLTNIWSASVGKHSEKLCQCYETVYGLIPEKVPEILRRSLIIDPHPSLCQVTRQMYHNHGEPFMEAYALMILLTQTKEAAYQELGQYIKENRPGMEGVIQAMERVEYVEEGDYYQVVALLNNHIYQIDSLSRRLDNGLDMRWYSLLMDSPEKYAAKWKLPYGLYRSSYDAMIARLYRSDKELQHAYGAYFYDKAMKQEVTIEGLRLMKRCGWTDYKGILAAAAGKSSNFGTYFIRQILLELPLSNVEAAKELDDLISNYGKKAVNGITILEKWREELRNGQTVDNL